ncbi:hypothetical protein [Elioraea sp.]|uniref:hypothetical protein n=1 Tax=Elioraea sp. TaxID=2185103 RepID=UPI0025B830DA|nr:hypothetical protein [Elioraea sp.]
MRLIIPFVFAFVGAVALVATHSFEDDRATHGNAFIALLAASHAAATAQGRAEDGVQASRAAAAVAQRAPTR